MAESSTGIRLALVHHANQYLITDGYDNREGISELVAGYSAALRLHQQYKVPFNLCISGTLIEAVAWHAPAFLELVRQLRQEGLLALIGGTYSENIMPLFSSSFNLRQLNELLWLYQYHLGCRPEEVTVCCIPEHVWDTEAMAPVLTSKELANGGYRFILAEDRLLFPIGNNYKESPRAVFDAFGPYRQRYAGAAEGMANYRFPTSAREPRSCKNIPYFSQIFRTYRIEGAGGLGIVPTSANLRYLVPPRLPEDWRTLDEMLQAACDGAGDDLLMVYRDDLEKPSGVGPWDKANIGDYENFLKWLASNNKVACVQLPLWLSVHPPRKERKLEAGTYYELAHLWHAGEDYRGWSEDPAWAPYAAYMSAAIDSLAAATQANADNRLLETGWKHLMASSYETAWHDATGKEPVPARWEKAVASHSRASLVHARAALWAGKGGKENSVPLTCRIIDVDGDGEEEVIMSNQNLFAVISPARGGRVVYLFLLTGAGGVQVIGNPSDDWNWQEELDRYMDRPANHPGAMADVGFEHVAYHVTTMHFDVAHALLVLTDTQKGSPLETGRKMFYMGADASALLVGYHLPPSVKNFHTEACFSPDYYRLLREGRTGLAPYDGQSWRGFRNGDASAWLALAGDESVAWAEPARVEAGHGLNLRVSAQSSHFHLLLGCGETNEESCRKLMEAGRLYHDSLFMVDRLQG